MARMMAPKVDENMKAELNQLYEIYELDSLAPDAKKNTDSDTYPLESSLQQIQSIFEGLNSDCKDQKTSDLPESKVTFGKEAV